ncbi:MAG: UbiX family flavin prenyltransferase [Anaerolineales bacterium]|jgi:4-hydroxy-3-polyprenylbenzoate decarboxylase
MVGEQVKRVVVGISGASGVILGIRTLEVLHEMGIETHLIISSAAKGTITEETDWKVSEVAGLAAVVYNHGDTAAAIASGSYFTQGMIVIPCSIKTLSAIANSYASNLLARAADVTLKEGRPLILVVRETPLHIGHLRLMSEAAQMGAVIFPPMPAFYTRPASIEDLIDDTVGRVLARFGIENNIYKKWKD